MRNELRVATSRVFERVRGCCPRAGFPEWWARMSRVASTIASSGVSPGNHNANRESRTRSDTRRAGAFWPYGFGPA